jgi:biopolymer transport protein ExbB/TolQ
METIFGDFTIFYDPDLSPKVTIIVCGLIIIISIWGLIGRWTASRKNHLVSPLTALAPSAVISLGIFGTFLGIFLGLINFDTSDINSSIPSLLEGLKTAFITSLFGMFFSILLRYIYGHYEKKDISKDKAKSDDPVVLLRNISGGVSTLSNTVTAMGEMIIKCFQSDEEYSLVSQLKLIRTDMGDLKREIIKSLNEFGEKVAELGTEAMIEALRNVIEQFNARLNDLVGEEFKQLKDAMIKLNEWQEYHRKSIDEMQANLSAYLDNVKESTLLLERAASSMNYASEHLDSIDGSLSTISVSAEDIENHIEQLKSQNAQLQEFINSIMIIGEEAKTVLPSLEKHIKAFTSDLEQATQEAKVKIQDTGKSLEETVLRISDNMQKFTETHAQQTEKSIELITKDLENVLNTSLSSLAGQLASLSNKFAEDYTPLTNRLRAVVQIAERMGNV